MPIAAVRELFKWEISGGVLLVLAAGVALLLSNSPWSSTYDVLIETPIAIQVGEFTIAKPLLLWINDGLMALFFFLVGLEIKRELLEGGLSRPSQAALPVAAAIGGMAVPAAIYCWLNWESARSLNGWAIPAATDIAFSLAVLALAGSRVPASLKVLLTAIAIIDDLGAIVIIALFYTDHLSLISLGFAGIAIAALVLLNRLHVTKISAYVFVGTLLWLSVLKSGVHATLAGVILAFAVPLKERDAHGESLLKQMEHNLHPWVTFGVLPVFGFANAGVSFAGLSWTALVEPVTLGIAAGLFLGKQIGIFAVLGALIGAGLSRMPEGAGWLHLYGVSVLCGIGFTMSLFIGSLAFEHASFDAPVRLGVLAGSLVSSVVGFCLLRLAAAKTG